MNTIGAQTSAAASEAVDSRFGRDLFCSTANRSTRSLYWVDVNDVSRQWKWSRCLQVGYRRARIKICERTTDIDTEQIEPKYMWKRRSHSFKFYAEHLKAGFGGGTIVIRFKHILSTAFFFGLMMGSLSAVAGANVADRSITKIFTYSDLAILVIDPPFSNSENCANAKSDRYFAIDWSTVSNYKSVYAAALLAYSTDQTVGFGINGCNTRWGGGIPQIYRLDMGP